ncbi:type VII secretion protein EccB [Actinocatenispora thailandica]|uniref:Type VII secretion protein EccB n=1 Tax=Actinocatenispora thailandica TaxID=227318 RepID=A0A7R7DUU1_9ACTN|nr:type VII secretion protein EccB [Actinocatenispora thailandica]BCJ38265.1 type VII secretion protein EccB [Actinocatenispora thailandica]
MRSRREQIRAYRFVTRRIVSALLGGDPEVADPPLRRAGLTTFASVMVGALVLAGFGVYGLVRPGGNTSWRSGDVLIVEKETGTRFVYRGGRLHPVLNYASARLVLKNAAPTTTTVSATSLAGVARGRPVGIAGAPDALPAADSLHALPWSVCSANDTGDVTTGTPRVTVAVHRNFGGTDLGRLGVIVHASGEKPALLWHGQRLRIPNRESLASLGWGTAPQVAVAPAFLNAIPAGPDLVAPTIPDLGRSGPTVGAGPAKIGTVYRLTSAANSEQFFVLLDDGLAQVSQPVEELLLGKQGLPSPQQLSPADYKNVPSSKRDLSVPGLPDHQPVLATRDNGQVAALCVSWRGRGGTTIQRYRSAPDALTGTEQAAAGGVDDTGALTADAVLVPGGGGALVAPAAARGVSTSTTYVVTDQGIRYAVPDDEARTALGYGDVTPVSLPENLIDLVPAGPVLDQKKASQYVSTTPTSPSPSPSRK